MRTLHTRSRLPDPSQIDLARVRALVRGAALRNNFQAIRKQATGLGILPMVKANGYGHGSAWVARELMGQPDLVGFGVATLAEGAFLREELGARARRLPIIIFSGMSPFSEEKARFCELHGLEPVLITEACWRAFRRGEWASRLKYHLEFDTGMNRLGISSSLAPAVAREVAKLPIEERPESVFTHLACAESPSEQDCLRQIERYDTIRHSFRPASPATRLHFANSAAIWNGKDFRLEERADWVRPGISLYGVPPWREAPVRGLEMVMELRARVVNVFTANSGDPIGYGSTYRVPRGEKQRVAVISAGYGDGIHRVLSNQIGIRLGGRMEQFLGRISMDLAAVSASPSIEVGDEATLFDNSADLWALSKKAGTIPYELLTSVSARVVREETD
jgi:alanine racemase